MSIQAIGKWNNPYGELIARYDPLLQQCINKGDTQRLQTLSKLMIFPILLSVEHAEEDFDKHSAAVLKYKGLTLALHIAEIAGLDDLKIGLQGEIKTYFSTPGTIVARPRRMEDQVIISYCINKATARAIGSTLKQIEDEYNRIRNKLVPKTEQEKIIDDLLKEQGAEGKNIRELKGTPRYDIILENIADRVEQLTLERLMAS